MSIIYVTGYGLSRRMKNYQELGRITLGSTLRQLAEQLTLDAENIYSKFEFKIDPKWFPVFYVLAQKQASSVVNIAKEINHSHVSVSKIINEMSDASLIVRKKSKEDSRVTLLSLSARGKKMIPIMELQCKAVDSALEQLLQDTGIDFWSAVKLTQQHLKYHALSARINLSETSQQLRIIDYAPKYQSAFRDLNVEWISKYWEMEEPDHMALDDPDAYILDKGGCILIAVDEGDPVGCCALLKIDSHNYEMIKLAVSPNRQGEGIGLSLGRAIIERAQALGAQRIYLESNSVLEPALNLYKKLGFQAVETAGSPYQRCDIQMEMYL